MQTKHILFSILLRVLPSSLPLNSYIDNQLPHLTETCSLKDRHLFGLENKVQIIFLDKQVIVTFLYK